MKIKKTFDNKGSAIVMALVTVCVLLVLGLAVSTLALGTLESNVADSVNNDAYYAAEAGVNSALEQVKHEVSSYYNAMLNDRTLHAGFFDGIYAALGSFREPVVSGITTQTTFHPPTGTNDLKVFRVTTLATTAGGTQYEVEGSIEVERLALPAGGTPALPTDTTIYTGGTINLGSGGGFSGNAAGSYVVTGGANYTGGTWQFALSNMATGNVVPPAVYGPLPEVLTYPGYTNPSFPSIPSGLPDITHTSGGSVDLTGTNVRLEQHPVTGGTIRAYNSVTILSSMNSCTANVYSRGKTTVGSTKFTGTVFARGDVAVESSCTEFNGTIYSDGNVTVTGVHNFTGTVYANGSVSINGGQSFSGEIFSNNGKVVASSNIFSGMIYCGGTMADSVQISGGNFNGSLFSTGPVTFNNGASGESGVIYSASGPLKLGSSNRSGIFFSGGDILFTGGGRLYGMIIAHGSVTCTSSWLNPFDYSKLPFSKLSASSQAFFGIGADGNPVSGGGGGPVADADVFGAPRVNALGRKQ